MMRLPAKLICLCALLSLLTAAAMAGIPPPSLADEGSVAVPRVKLAPALEDFLSMAPSERISGQLVKVSGFTQRTPHDGEPATQQTDVYMGYDARNLYVIFVCFDKNPGLIRARMSRREDIYADDSVLILLDTFHDHRRAYAFSANPLGVQWDALYSEGIGYDNTFDTVWQSKGKVTSQGYVVWLAIPFRSLRFDSRGPETWGILLNRVIPRSDENSFWPCVKATISGMLRQEGQMSGLAGISPGRNIQFNPYALAGGSRSLNQNDVFSKGFDGSVGLDAKVVLKDKLVFDATLHPDFSQVEADAPQVTVNQRFRVYFPEKRPFFMENSNFFTTPFQLVFTRNMADPTYGVRMTGKVDHWALGVLTADDRAPGEVLLPGEIGYGERARDTIFRVSRDIFGLSTVGAIVTDYEFAGQYNRIAGVDSHLIWRKNWSADLQAVTSWTCCSRYSWLPYPYYMSSTGTPVAGPAYHAEVNYEKRDRYFWANYSDVGTNFVSALGYFARNDYRRVDLLGYQYFRPKNRKSRVINWGPQLYYNQYWDHSGTSLNRSFAAELDVYLKGQSDIKFEAQNVNETLRPKDYYALPGNRTYSDSGGGAQVDIGFFKKVVFGGNFTWQRRVNYVPTSLLGGPLPGVGGSGSFYLTLRPRKNLRIDNTYIIDILHVLRPEDYLVPSALNSVPTAAGRNVYNNHILRTKWNYQVNRELSLRVILEYNTVLANPGLTYLQSTKGFNADVLVTYLVHPGTALYVGYNSDMANMRPGLPVDPYGQIVRSPSGFLNDGRQFFVKIAYLFRY